MWCLLIQSVLKVKITFTVDSYWCKICSYWRLPDIDSIYWVCSWTIWIALALQKSKSVERIPIDGGNDGEWKDSEELAPEMQSLAYGASTEDMFFDALWWCLQVYSFTKNLGFICGFSNCISLAMMYEVSWSVLHWNQNSSSTSGFSEAWMSGTAHNCMYIRLHAVTICCIISPGLDTFAKAWMVFWDMCLWQFCTVQIFWVFAHCLALVHIKNAADAIYLQKLWVGGG